MRFGGTPTATAVRRMRRDVPPRVCGGRVLFRGQLGLGPPLPRVEAFDESLRTLA